MKASIVEISDARNLLMAENIIAKFGLASATRKSWWSMQTMLP